MPVLIGYSAFAILSMLLVGGVHGQAPPDCSEKQANTGFKPCDALIAANLSHAVHLPSSPLYPSLVANGSWALYTRKSPWCFVLPSTTAEVSESVSALRGAGGGAGDWHIAIRSGGHGGDNSNNIAIGVTIDLTNLNATTYNPTTKTARLQTGARWQSVYNTLDKIGVSVTGGREGVVGVGGLLLGAGVSWYTPRTGFACDSVVNYEVVLASGKIVNANATSNSDLWRALKGGSGNFGIVTSFDVEAFPAQNLSKSLKIFAEDHFDELIEAITWNADLDQSHQDEFALSTLTYNYDNATKTGVSIVTTTEISTVGNANSTSFEKYSKIPTLTPPTTQLLSLAVSANGTQVPGDIRYAGSGALTVFNDARVLSYIFQEHARLVEDLKASLGEENFGTIYDFQAFPSYLPDIGVQKGGNMLGLERDSRSRLLIAGGVRLTGPNSDLEYPQVVQKVAAVNINIERFAKSVESDSNFVYIPYGNARQDPLGNYGPKNLKHMRETARKYDPKGFFQSRVPGGFKISRVD